VDTFLYHWATPTDLQGWSYQWEPAIQGARRTCKILSIADFQGCSYNCNKYNNSDSDSNRNRNSIRDGSRQIKQRQQMVSEPTPTVQNRFVCQNDFGKTRKYTLHEDTSQAEERQCASRSALLMRLQEVRYLWDYKRNNPRSQKDQSANKGRQTV